MTSSNAPGTEGTNIRIEVSETSWEYIEVGNVRYLDMLVRLLLYNSWKINRKIVKKGREQGYIKRAWTLNRNKDILIDWYISDLKKSVI